MTLLYFAGNQAVPGLYLGWHKWEANYLDQTRDGFRWHWGHLELVFDYPEGLRRLELKNRAACRRMERKWSKRQPTTSA